MKKICFSIIFLGGWIHSVAQNMILHDPVSAKVFNSEKYSDVRGTPFLIDEWMKGSAYTAKGRYDQLALKLDVYSNTLFYENEGKAFEFEEKVNRFILMPDPSDSSTYRYFINGLSGAGIHEKQFLETLEDGQVTLFRYQGKLLSELSEINRGIVKTFTDATKYFLLLDGSLKQLRLNRKEVLSALNDKQREIEEFIKINKLQFKKYTDLMKVVQYYNSI